VGSSVFENQTCSTEALVDNTKNGRPINPKSARSSHPTGFASGGGAALTRVANGRTASGNASRTAYTAT
jgi:hypothetical protein